MHPAADSPIRRRLMLPGEMYHSDEVHGKNGELWLGLLRTATGGYRTALVHAKVTAVQDPVVDEENQRTGKRVGIAEPGRPVFLLKGYDALAGRFVRTSVDGRFKLSQHAESNFYFAGRKIELQVQPSGRKEKFPPGTTVEIFQVQLKQGEQVAPLPLVVTDYNQVHLLWAGDLDGDGKVDLLFEDSGYNWSSSRLFLSSAAKRGEAVAEVGQFYTTGC